MKKLALVLFIVLAAAGLWWWESSRLATENLLDAAEDGDVAELEELVDAERFAASLRAELPQRTAPAPIAPPLSRPSASPPATMDPLLAGLAGDTQLVQLRQAAKTSWDLEREGLNSFRVVRRSGKGEALPALLFERDGLHWLLVGVERANGPQAAKR